MDFYRAVILLTIFMGVAIAAPQRSPYAPAPVVYPQVLPQYTSTPDPNVENRFGSDTPRPFNTQTDRASLYPVDSLNWIQSEWPRDKLPFNVINSQHLQAHRGSGMCGNVPCNSGVQQDINSGVRSSFSQG